MMNLITMPLPVGGHLGGWRHPESWSDTSMGFRYAVEVTKIAERGKFDSVFLADGNSVRYMETPEVFASANSPGSRPINFEPLTLLSALSQHTNHIGLVATATTTYDTPYMVARKFASLDHISEGRAGWNVVTTTYSGDSKNFGFDEHMAREDRYSRASEFVDVVRGLWDSWADDAIIEDKAGGRFLDPAKVHTLNHRGESFSIKGPLNITRPPQGHPVIFMAGQSERGRELAAQKADAVFGAGDTKEACQTAYRDIKERMEKYGRTPESLRFLPGASVFVGRTNEEAEELYAELQALIPPAVGVAYLSQRVLHDLSPLPIDGPMPDLPSEVEAGNSFRTYIVDTAKRENLTIRQTYQRILPALGSALFKGNPVDIADQMEDWFKSKACDGFMISSPVQPKGLAAFVDLVVPELQRRGIFRTEYAGKTLRENMGLAKPGNQFFSTI